MEDEQIMIVVTYISLLLLVFYVVLILVYWIGWLRIKPFHRKSAETMAYTFSILVPARNEEKVITRCLQDIIEQDYDPQKFEIIVVNDHSTDDTEGKVKQFIREHPLFQVKLLNMTDDPQKRKLKKAAITYGVSQTNYEYIILTDADCERGNRWLSTINQFIFEKGSKLIYAPVEFKAENTFEKGQSLEFAGLVGIGASAIRLRHPNMCSAANLIFEKEVFNEVEGYKGYDGIASGDDEFLLHKIFKRYPDHVHFLKHFDAIVYTSANKSVRELADQRRRWASKSAKYENRYITLIMIGAYFFNAAILFNLIFQFKLGLGILLIKAIVEGLFLGSVLRFFRRIDYLWLLPMAQLFHIIYVLIIGVLANTGTYTWKGRNVR